MSYQEDLESITRSDSLGLRKVVSKIGERADDEIEELRTAIRQIYEVWAGSEECDPVTTTEGYQQHLIEEMRDIAADCL